MSIYFLRKFLVRGVFASSFLSFACFFIGIWSEVEKFNYTGLLFAFTTVICLFVFMLVFDLEEGFEEDKTPDDLQSDD